MNFEDVKAHQHCWKFQNTDLFKKGIEKIEYKMLKSGKICHRLRLSE